MNVLSHTSTPISAPPLPPKQTSTPAWGNVETIMGQAGQHKGNLLQFAFPRNETLKDGGMEIPPSMGMATALNLQMVGTKAAATGDFVLLADEVNPVLKELTQHGIAVTALHSHMLYESTIQKCIKNNRGDSYSM